MKLVYLILFFFTVGTQAQERINITYGVLFNGVPYSEEFIANYPEEHERFIQEIQRASELTFGLRINQNKALFTHPKVDKNDQNLFFAYQNTEGDYSYYTDFDKNEQMVQFPYWGAEIYIENPINEIPWQLTKESKKIGDYTCFKATKEYVEKSGGFEYAKKIEAWYAPEIPIKFGPKQYVGLPGLIVELKENHITYFLKEINYHPKNQPPIVPPANGIKMTWQEFAEKSLTIKNTAKQAIINGGR